MVSARGAEGGYFREKAGFLCAFYKENRGCPASAIGNCFIWTRRGTLMPKRKSSPTQPHEEAPVAAGDPMSDRARVGPYLPSEGQGIAGPGQYADSRGSQYHSDARPIGGMGSVLLQPTPLGKK